MSLVMDPSLAVLKNHIITRPVFIEEGKYKEKRALFLLKRPEFGSLSICFLPFPCLALSSSSLLLTCRVSVFKNLAYICQLLLLLLYPAMHHVSPFLFIYFFFQKITSREIHLNARWLVDKIKWSSPLV